MSNQRDDTLTILRSMRVNLTRLQGELTDALELVAAMTEGADTNHTCPECGNRVRAPLTMNEHLHYSHQGPEPPEWAEAERLASIAT